MMQTMDASGILYPELPLFLPTASHPCCTISSLAPFQYTFRGPSKRGYASLSPIHLPLLGGISCISVPSSSHRPYIVGNRGASGSVFSCLIGSWPVTILESYCVFSNASRSLF